MTGEGEGEEGGITRKSARAQEEYNYIAAVHYNTCS